MCGALKKWRGDLALHKNGFRCRLIMLCMQRGYALNCLTTSKDEAYICLLQYGRSKPTLRLLRCHGTFMECCGTLFTMIVMLLLQDCLEMRCVGSSTDGLPPGVETIPGPRTQRQVLHACRIFDSKLFQVAVPS